MNADPRLALLRAMLRLRRIEEAIAERYREQEMRCPMHLSIGQEAIAAGVCAALARDDVVFGNHRAHAHYLAKGGSLPAMIAEMYGRADGCCGGRGGSMHLIDLPASFLGATPIVGGTIPLTVGAAWALRLNHEPRVAVTFFGDGAFEEGVVHESLNFAALHRLPVLFVCENNRYSCYTRLDERQPDRPIHGVARAHGWQVEAGDGNDAVAVHTLAHAAISRARAGEGPQFLELYTQRWREHCGPYEDDDLGYREPGELALWKERCPIATLAAQLGATAAEPLERWEREIAAEIEAAFAFALASPPPAAASITAHVYA